MNPSVSASIEMCNEIRNENTIYVQAPAAHTMKTMLDQVSKYGQVVELSNFERLHILSKLDLPVSIQGRSTTTATAILEIKTAFKIVAARVAFKIVACFIHHGNSKVCLQVQFRFI